jgi:hypothetical protein
MIGRGADRRTDPADNRFQFRVGSQEGHSDGPRPLLGHAPKLPTAANLDQLTHMPRTGRLRSVTATALVCGRAAPFGSPRR